MTVPRIPLADWTEPADVCGYGSDEEVTGCDVEGVVAGILDSAGMTRAADEDVLDRVKWPIEVTAWRRMEITASDLEMLADNALEAVMERLDEEWGPPDDAVDVRPEWRAAAAALARTIVETYPVWACEPVAVVLVSREAAAAMLEAAP